jgi:hypothetical protein
VFVRFGKVAVILSLVTMLSAHWLVLQSIAWTSMLADNLRSSPFPEALEKTFDGKHPCGLCKAIDAGKKSEQKKEFTGQTYKPEFPPANDNSIFIASFRFQTVPQSDAFCATLPHRPPTPPPRGFFA